MRDSHPCGLSTSSDAPDFTDALLRLCHAAPAPPCPINSRRAPPFQAPSASHATLGPSFDKRVLLDCGEASVSLCLESVSSAEQGGNTTAFPPSPHLGSPCAAPARALYFHTYDAAARYARENGAEGSWKHLVGATAAGVTCSTVLAPIYVCQTRLTCYRACVLC